MTSLHCNWELGVAASINITLLLFVNPWWQSRLVNFLPLSSGDNTILYPIVLHCLHIKICIHTNDTQEWSQLGSLLPYYTYRAPNSIVLTNPCSCSWFGPVAMHYLSVLYPFSCQFLLSLWLWKIHGNKTCLPVLCKCWINFLCLVFLILISLHSNQFGFFLGTFCFPLRSFTLIFEELLLCLGGFLYFYLHLTFLMVSTLLPLK